MAEVAALEIQIGANVDKAVAGIQQFDKSLFDLQNELKTFKAAQETTFDPKQFVQYGQKINSITQQIKSRLGTMDQAMEQTGQATARLTKSASSSTNSLFALSGVVQDAPFGFRAVANNVTFFAQEMAYSTKAAGSFKAAIAGLGEAFLGPAGVIFAVSAITSLITALIGTEKKASDATKELKSQITTLGQGVGKSIASSQKAAIQLDILYHAAVNAAVGTDTRRKAAEKLKAFYPSIFKDFSTEQIMLGAAAKAYATYADNILKAAQAQGAFNAIAKNSEKRANIFGQILDIENGLADATKANKAKIAEFNQEFDKILPNSQATNIGARINQVRDLLAKPAEVNKLLSSGQITRADVENISGLADALTNVGAGALDADIKLKALLDQYTKIGQASNAIKKSLNITDFVNSAQNPNGGSGAAKAKPEKLDYKTSVKGLNAALQSARDNYRAFTDVASANIAGTVSAQFDEIKRSVQSTNELLTQAQVKYAQFQTRLKEGREAAAADIRQGTIDAIAGITEGFATGGFAGAVKNLLSTLGEIAIQLGEIAIGVGVGIQGIKLALESLNPAAALAAGVGLIAIGAIAKSSAASIKLASGGIAYGPTHALIGEYAGAKSNPEVVAPLDKLKDLFNNLGGRNTGEIRITGEFRQSGSDLVAVVNNATKRNGRIN